MVDVVISWIGFDTQQGSCRHDLPGLAVAALRHLMLNPRGLHWMHRRWRSQPFDGSDFAGDIANVENAGTHSRTVNMHGASAAHCDAAAIFRTCYSEPVTQDPEQRHIIFDIHLVDLTIYL